MTSVSRQIIIILIWLLAASAGAQTYDAYYLYMSLSFPIIITLGIPVISKRRTVRETS